MTRRSIYPPAGLPEETIPIGRKKSRQWDKSNRAYCYIVPSPLHALARQMREDINSIAHYDETGQPRNDQTTADQIASVLADRALSDVARNPALLTTSTNRHGRGQMTVFIKEWDAWQKPAPLRQLPKPPARKKSAKHPHMFIGYRWPAETDQAIRRLAAERNLPIGETVLCLLQIGIEAYKRHDFKVVVEVRASVRVVGWE